MSFVSSFTAFLSPLIWSIPSFLNLNVHFLLLPPWKTQRLWGVLRVDLGVHKCRVFQWKSWEKYKMKRGMGNLWVGRRQRVVVDSVWLIFYFYFYFFEFFCKLDYWMKLNWIVQLVLVSLGFDLGLYYFIIFDIFLKILSFLIIWI